MGGGAKWACFILSLVLSKGSQVLDVPELNKVGRQSSGSAAKNKVAQNEWLDLSTVPQLFCCASVTIHQKSDSIWYKRCCR